LTKFIAVRKEKKEMSIYESLRSGFNDFGHGDSCHGYPRMPVLDADQPAQIVALTAPDKRPSIETLNLMPPFERFFIECVLPPELHMAAGFTTDGNHDLYNQPISEIGLDINIHRDAKYVHTPEEKRPKTHLSCQPYYVVKNPPKGTDPLCKSSMHIYITLDADGIPTPIPEATPESLTAAFRENGKAFLVGQDGQVYGVMAHHRGVAKPGAWAAALEKGLNLESAFQTTVWQFDLFLQLLYAINSLHNKRTVLSTVQHSRQVRRAAQRNNQQPPDQKTIVIKDFVTVIQGPRNARAEGVEYPLGKVIGHWRRYGVDGRTGLLFGKYRGTFFVPSFLRGNPDRGETDHDYVLKAGAAA
jgi:hypothetical protein